MFCIFLVYAAIVTGESMPVPKEGAVLASLSWTDADCFDIICNLCRVLGVANPKGVSAAAAGGRRRLRSAGLFRLCSYRYSYM